MGSEKTREARDPVRRIPEFSYRRDSTLLCEGISLCEIAERVGTPAYVYSHASFSSAYRRFDRAFRGLP
ncbi:MAG TPA: hypothetical protein VJN21_03200, partial [Candidatus Acidoferrales bacterium]|nr:hypothetical protein [Candidatus Acidoferrales bacterium]